MGESERERERFRFSDPNFVNPDIIQQMADEAPAAVTPQIVGNAFVLQYYHILHQSPALVHRFYNDTSKLGRPEDDGTMSITTTMTAINEKILSLNYGEFRAEIKSVDAQESLNKGVHVLVTGYLTGKDNVVRDFTQSFFLATQERGGYYVLNDMFRYLEKANQTYANQVLYTEVEVPVGVEQEATPVQEDHVTEQNDALVLEANEEVVHNVSDNGEIKVEKEEEPVAEVVDEEPVAEVVDEEPVAEVVDEVPVQEIIQNMPNNSKVVGESNIKSEEVPKKSYASIVKDLKEKGLPFSSPAPVLRKPPQKSREQQVKPTPPASSNTDVSASILNAAENVNQDLESDGYSIYIKGLPYNATPSLLEDEFKKYGTIKNGGIQVRSKQGFCFGFVEYEEASAVQSAIEASPILMGGRKVIVEEKKSTNSGVNSRGRFPSGRPVNFRNESGYRNEGMRGRGNYGAGRGYGRGESNGKTEFSNRGNYRGVSTNNISNGYQRDESLGTNGGRMTRANGNGNVKNAAPLRVPATA
ncbi:nuclear transport factor 2-like [Heracleum sosnowskyi]|uniref:Nuclear transport factor 2-like n=1 Tax=Heracleum sosnowskyi TaxID=360622 RepID=A0AAD8GNN3_9APIA|nr:nuclear transport factor 2-like [Heracleum sosnowskyi]